MTCTACDGIIIGQAYLWSPTSTLCFRCFEEASGLAERARRLTHEEWEVEWRACFTRLRAKGYDLVKAQETARAITQARYGPQPGKAPIWVRVGAKIVGKQLSGVAPVEVSPMLQRIIVAVVFGIGAAGPVLAAALADAVISGQEWSGIASAFIVALWGKFSSSTTFLSATRPGETQSDKPGVTF